MRSPSSRPELVVATAATASHRAHVRVLAASLREHHPRLELVLVQLDEPVTAEPFTVVRFAELAGAGAYAGLPPMRQLVLAKVLVLRHLLDQGWPSVLYLDADMLVTGDLGSLLARVRRHALVLTPHFVRPPEGGDAVARELLVLRAGVYNAGVVGVSDRPAVRAFLAWWERRIATHGRSAPEQGLFYDQRWLDLAPGFVGDVHVLRDPAVNVGHWALLERLALAPPRLVHFSGYDGAVPERVSRHLPGVHVSELGPAAALFRDYARRLRAAAAF